MSKLLGRAAFCIFAASLMHTAVAQNGQFSFAVISHAVRTNAEESGLRNAIEASDAANLAFVVVNGIKAKTEPCTDELYQQRKAILNDAKNGLVVSLAASDWTDCKTPNGKSAAIGKLAYLRELLFFDEFSLGGTRIPVVRQATDPKFASFVENARWEIGATMFATLALPANNNNYVPEAGRNSEFEDRMIANRDWLHRIFTHAKHKKFAGIVLFCDGNPLGPPRPISSKRDGYAEVRRQITALAARFPGKVLVVHGGASPTSTPAITWRGNLGEIGVGGGAVNIAARAGADGIFNAYQVESRMYGNR